jgi:hypothetical protein
LAIGQTSSWSATQEIEISVDGSTPAIRLDDADAASDNAMTGFIEFGRGGAGSFSQKYYLGFDGVSDDDFDYNLQTAGQHLFQISGATHLRVKSNAIVVDDAVVEHVVGTDTYNVAYGMKAQHSTSLTSTAANMAIINFAQSEAGGGGVKITYCGIWGTTGIQHVDTGVVLVAYNTDSETYTITHVDRATVGGEVVTWTASVGSDLITLKAQHAGGGAETGNIAFVIEALYPLGDDAATISLS